MPGVPLFNARVEDLTHAEAIEAECLECGHRSSVPVSKVKERCRIGTVLDLPRVLRCDSCGKIGRSIVSARQALGYDQSS